MTRDPIHTIEVSEHPAGPVTTPMAPLLALTFLASIGTGLFWNGIPFIARTDYGYDEQANLVLFTVIGPSYVMAALLAGRLTRWAERWVRPRTLLGLILLVQAVFCLGPWLVTATWMLWVVTIVGSVTSALIWPLVESYLTAGRHGAAMRRSMGWWNVTWTLSVAAALWLMAPFMDLGTDGVAVGARLSIVLVGVLDVLAIACLPWFPAWPGAHDESSAVEHVGPEYTELLACARVLLPLSYVVMSAVSPLMPFVLDQVSVDSRWQTPITATWMLARVATVGLMWKLAFWHGRWGTLVASAACLALGFVGIIAAPSLAVVLAGLVVFGVGMGAVYFAALYYAMSVGRAEIDAGGRHEAAIGAGYAFGPMLGLLAIGLEGPEDAVASGDALSSEALLVALVALSALAAAWPAVRPYRRAFRRRRRSS